MRKLLIIFFSLAALAGARAAPPAPLTQAVDKWIGDRDQWAFTQSVREFAGGKVREERLERYDPSKPGESRWQLLAINGQKPTPTQWAEWQQRKMKKRLNPGKPLAEFFDFAQAAVTDENPSSVRYHLPLRNDHAWLFPVDRVNLKVTVNKATAAIDKIEAGIDEPFRVALGLGRLMDLDLDLQMNPSEQLGQSDNPQAAKPEGTARAVMNKLGERVEYVWGGFKRVTPHPDNAIPVSPK